MAMERWREEEKKRGREMEAEKRIMATLVSDAYMHGNVYMHIHTQQGQRANQFSIAIMQQFSPWIE